jgi:hypothetical protein
MNKPMTKQEWMAYLEQTWDAAQEEAWAEQAQPVAWISHSDNLLSWDKLYDHMEPLYTAPPQRQPLHDMAVFDLADTHLYEGSKNYGVLAFARAIEAAHGIKGEA